MTGPYGSTYSHVSGLQYTKMYHLSLNPTLLADGSGLKEFSDLTLPLTGVKISPLRLKGVSRDLFTVEIEVVAPSLLSELTSPELVSGHI